MIGNLETNIHSLTRDGNAVYINTPNELHSIHCRMMVIQLPNTINFSIM